MRPGGLTDYAAAESATAGFDFGKSYALRRGTRETIESKEDDALRKVDEAQHANTRATLDMMDRHQEMVKKSQELFRVREKKLAIERQNQERREEQTALLAEMAIRNAERSDLFGM